MMWWWGDGHMGAGGWIGLAFMIVFWIAVVVAIVYLIRYLVVHPGSRWHWDHPYWHGEGPQGPSAGGPGSQGPGVGTQGGKSEAVRILEERYARGEIDREEFLRRKADLSS
jgi:putative membrane protein